ncbi:hypothetical protein CY34DRAFT_565119 [Suillus luteus UH-Slu-Lm8-n1]|uniref:Uncharacterized protein n=1 Tax=Suillus luteus UH-Slu-Lm8-n1 TaxID=930992 RepID=A0A0D0BGA8_9AGAM|nr:hypothetical protein CY34DRAFT_565119 [Suillus luteus UH-Slu-Lm8-n1]
MEVDSGKPKRDDQLLPSITYLVGDRSFDRLFKGIPPPKLTTGGFVLISIYAEKSLEEIRGVVRRKLQLPSNSTVKLKQLRGSKVIDLDDDDDFDAFSARARLMKLVDVAVEISGATSSTSAGEAPKTSVTGAAKKKRKANNDQPSKDDTTTVTPEPKTKKRKTDQPAVTMQKETASTSKVASMDHFVEEFIEKLSRKEPAPVSARTESSLKSSAKPEVVISTKAPIPTGGEPAKKPKATKAGTAKDAAEKPPKKTKKAKEIEKTKETSSLPVSADKAVPSPSGPSEPPNKSSGTKKVTTQSSVVQSGEKSVNGAVDGAATSEKKKNNARGKEVESEKAPATPAPTKSRKKVVIEGASEAPAPKAN